MADVPAVVGRASATPTPRYTYVTWWENVAFSATHLALAAFLSCTSLRTLYRCGRLFGTIEWMIDYKRRRRFTAVFERVQGPGAAPAQRRSATREYFRRSRCDKLFYLLFDRIPHDTVMSLFSFRNRELLDDAVRRGRGVYLAMSHHGPQHIAGMLLAAHGYAAAAVRDRQEGGLRRWVQERLDRRYPQFRRMRVLFADGYPRDIYRCLREGYVLGSAMDVSRLRRPNQRAQEVSIFGEKRRFLSGPVHIALRCGAPVLQAFIVPEKYFHYRLEIVKALAEPQTPGDEDAIVARVMSDYAANVEKYIRATPALITRI
ncbi:MAG: hypothetical protein ACE5HE_11655 [Phycisphaerae bacterium]